MAKIVFTNGCFDLIHPGHIDLLDRAKAHGTRLIVGINSDSSVRAIKGEPQPFVSENDRKSVLLGLKAVDEVRIFSETTPENLIREIKPDVLIKGGDWPVQQIVGADFVLGRGGEVLSLPLKNGYSTSSLVERIRTDKHPAISQRQTENSLEQIIENSLGEHLGLFKTITETHLGVIAESAEMIAETVENGKKILLCGNGGSAADAQHIAAEFVGRYETERKALPAIALTTDTSALTALANDYGFEKIFARQVEALAEPGDLLIAISTSGNSPNVNTAVMAARRKGCRTLGLTGRKGRKLASLCDLCLLVPAVRTARIQEAHITIGHIWCEIVDARIAAQ